MLKLWAQPLRGAAAKSSRRVHERTGPSLRPASVISRCEILPIGAFALTTQRGLSSSSLKRRLGGVPMSSQAIVVDRISQASHSSASTHPWVSLAGVVVAFGIASTASNGKDAHARVSKPSYGSNQWQVYDELGSGSYGVVKLGRSQQTGEAVAVKMIDSKRASQDSLKQEINTLKKIKSLGGHPNIVDIKDVFHDGSHVCVVTELVRGGELFQHIVKYGSYDENRSAKIMSDIAEAIYFLHSNGLLHKDLKPENIMMTSPENTRDNQVKVVDFGSAGDSSVTECSNDNTGTSAYWPPELITSGTYSCASDMWALGCILYILLTGVHPFDKDGECTDEMMLHNIVHENVKFDQPEFQQVSEQAKSLIISLLQKNPADRLTAKQLLDHPWIKAASSQKKK